MAQTVGFVTARIWVKSMIIFNTTDVLIKRRLKKKRPENGNKSFRTQLNH